MKENELDAMMLEYRRKRFDVTCDKSRYSKGGFDLSVTANGSQWTTISLLPEEIPRVIAALSAALEQTKEAK